MRIKTHLAVGLGTIAVAAAAFLLMAHVFDSEHQPPQALAEPEMEIIEVAQTEILAEDTLPAVDLIPEPQPEAELPELPALIANVRDIYIENNRVWVATAGGLVQTDRNGRHYRFIEAAEGLDSAEITEILPLPGRTLFCTTDNFYEYLGPDVFRQVELPFLPPIVFCHAFDSLNYLSSLDQGVFKFVDDQPVLIKSDLLVSAMVFAPDGLWVGTDGDGLWHYNGEKWRRRWLRSDTMALAYVTTLAYRWPHLMVGTPEGLYRFDGGMWEPQTGSQSDFPGGWVTDLAFGNHRWYVGTAASGLWVYDGIKFAAVADLATMSITCIKVFRGDVYAGTQNSGVYVRRAGEWRPLYSPEEVLEISPQLLTLF